MTFCVVAENCVVFDRATKLPGLSPSHSLCYGCDSSFRRELNCLRYDYVDLSQLIPKADGRNDEANIFRPKPESSPPLAMGPFHLRARIAYLVQVAERTLRDHLGDSAHSPMPCREGFALDQAIRYLSGHVEALSRLPGIWDHWADDDGGSVELSGLSVLMLFGRLHKAARVMCGLDSRTITVPGECPTCAVPSLRRVADDADRIWCVHCRATMTSDEYLKRMRMQFAP